MSKLNDLRIALAKAISGLKESISEEGPTIAYESLAIGSELYKVVDGSYEDLEDGIYTIEGTTVQVKDGIIVEPEPEAEPIEAEAEEPDKVAALEEQIASLSEQVASLLDRVAALEDAPVAKPAEEEDFSAQAPQLGDLEAVFKNCKKYY